MSRAPLPKTGCFKAAYPNTEWQEVLCETAPAQLPTTGFRPEIVGAGNGDWSAQATGSISSATGTFTYVGNATGVMSESDSATGQANAFMLQINTNTFQNATTAKLCKEAMDPSMCKGWQQFLFSNPAGCTLAGQPHQSCIYIEYWLLNYNNDCSKLGTGWQQPSGGGCFIDSQYVGIPVQTIAALETLSLQGQTDSGGTDRVNLFVGGTLYANAAGTNVLNLQGSWNTAEFNVFGNRNGTRANFNDGWTIDVMTGVDDGTTSAPVCAGSSFTAETSNLNLLPCCPVAGFPPGVGTPPSIVFSESNVAGATSVCACPANATWSTDGGLCVCNVAGQVINNGQCETPQPPPPSGGPNLPNCFANPYSPICRKLVCWRGVGIGWVYCPQLPQ
jgi:hypothetical protein